jgi:hypothetical protein
MNINKYLDVINACRFCFMCRHLSAVGNVTFKEADTPRGRALILDKVRMDNSLIANADYIKTIYDADLSAACRRHCVSHYDENSLLLAARQDIVAAGLAPPSVAALARDLQNVDFQVKGTGEILYYIDTYSQRQMQLVEAFGGIAGNVATISGGDTGKALKILGFVNEAREVAAKFAAAVSTSGARTLVTSCPASYDALKHDLPIDGVTVLHSSEFLLQRGLKAKAAKPACYLDSDFLKAYNNVAAPRELLLALGYELKQFATNDEESFSAGEGAAVYDRVNPKLTAKLCERICEMVDVERDLLITSSPYTLHVLKTFRPQLNIISIEQAACRALEA